jgi:hypothetical protein
MKEIAQENQVPFFSVRSYLERKVPPGRYTLRHPRRNTRTIAIQVSGLKEEGESNGQTPILVSVPLGKIRFPPEQPYHQLRDDGTNLDLQAGDGIYTARIQDYEAQDFEFAPARRILLQGGAFQLFMNTDPFYCPPALEEVEEMGVYYSPVIEFRKPSFHAYVTEFDGNVLNPEGAQVIAEALTRVVLDHFD